MHRCAGDRIHRRRQAYQSPAFVCKAERIDIHFGDPKDEIPGKNTFCPHTEPYQGCDVDLDRVRRSNIKNAVGTHKDELTDDDIRYLVEETNSSEEFVRSVIAGL